MEWKRRNTRIFQNQSKHKIMIFRFIYEDIQTLLQSCEWKSTTNSNHPLILSNWSISMWFLFVMYFMNLLSRILSCDNGQGPLPLYVSSENGRRNIMCINKIIIHPSITAKVLSPLYMFPTNKRNGRRNIMCIKKIIIHLSRHTHTHTHTHTYLHTHTHTHTHIKSSLKLWNYISCTIF